MLGILAFGLAGLGCSALLPLTISFGQGELAAVAGGRRRRRDRLLPGRLRDRRVRRRPAARCRRGALDALCGARRSSPPPWASGRSSSREGGRARRRSARAQDTGREPVSPTAPSGEQVELALGDQRAVITEVGAGLRTYSAGGRELLDGYAADAMVTSGRGQVLLPWPNRIEDGAYEFDGRRHQLALTEPTARNAIHGLVRWVGVERRRAGAEPGRDDPRAPRRSRATRSRSRSSSSTPSRRTACASGRPRRTPARRRARSARARTRT